MNHIGRNLPGPADFKLKLVNRMSHSLADTYGPRPDFWEAFNTTQQLLIPLVDIWQYIGARIGFRVPFQRV
jgi:hypothetical protein